MNDLMEADVSGGVNDSGPGVSVPDGQAKVPHLLVLSQVASWLIVARPLASGVWPGAPRRCVTKAHHWLGFRDPSDPLTPPISPQVPGRP
jgi:hypothetical protein